MNIFLKRILVVVGCFCFSVHSFGQNWEVDLLNDINNSTPGNGWKVVTNSVYPIAAAVPISMFVYSQIAKDKKTEYKSYNVIGSIVISMGITKAIKIVADRQRPAGKYPGIIFSQGDPNEGHSFPSGHASVAFATATSLSLQYKKWYVIAPSFAWASAVGYSRMKLGEHYPTDVLAGAIVGAGSAYASNWLTQKIIGKQKYKKAMAL